MFERPMIFRAAHADARFKIANNRAWRTYREAFAVSLRQEWQKAKDELFGRAVEAERTAASAAAEAHPLPIHLTRRIADLRIFAGPQAFTAYGAANHRLILAEAEDIERAARCMMIPAQETRHVAH